MKSTNPKAKIKGPDKFDETQVYSLEVTGFPIENCRVEWYLDKYNTEFNLIADENSPFNPKEVTIVGNRSGKGALRAKISYYETYVNDQGEDAFNLIGVKKIYKKIICNTPVEPDDDDDTKRSSRSSSSYNPKQAFDTDQMLRKVQQSIYRGNKKEEEGVDMGYVKPTYSCMETAIKYEFSNPRSDFRAQQVIKKSKTLRSFHRRIYRVTNFLNSFIERSGTQIANSALRPNQNNGARLVDIRYTTAWDVAGAAYWPFDSNGQLSGFKKFGSTGFVSDRFTLLFNVNYIKNSPGTKINDIIYHELCHALGISALGLHDKYKGDRPNLDKILVRSQVAMDKENKKHIIGAPGCSAPTMHIWGLDIDYWPNTFEAYKKLTYGRPNNGGYTATPLFCYENSPILINKGIINITPTCPPTYVTDGSSMQHLIGWGFLGQYDITSYYGIANNMLHWISDRRGRRISHMELGAAADLGYVIKKGGQKGVMLVRPEPNLSANQRVIEAWNRGAPNYTTGPVRGALTKGNTRAIKPLPKFDNYDVSTPEGDKKRTSALFEFLIDSNM